MYSFSTFWPVLLAFTAFFPNRNFASASSTSNRDTGNPVIHEVWQFPNDTWIENLAVRPNGHLLVTMLNTPELYQVDPLDPGEPALIHKFPRALGLLGIAEVEHDPVDTTFRRPLDLCRKAPLCAPPN